VLNNKQDALVYGLRGTSLYSKFKLKEKLPTVDNRWKLTIMTLRWLSLYIFVLLISACAKPPLAEMDAAEYMVARAYEMQAQKHAPAEYQAAHSALEDARKSLQNSDYSEADESLDFALIHARRAAFLTEESKARMAEEEIRQQREEAEHQAALKAQAEAETEARQEKIKAKVRKPAPPAKPDSTPPTTIYQVGEGETLWTISAQAVVYHDALLWPLLYQANRDQIKDPRQIFPGQTLNIRRDLTAEDREMAHQKARESDIFPVPHDIEKSPADNR